MREEAGVPHRPGARFYAEGHLDDRGGQGDRLCGVCVTAPDLASHNRQSGTRSGSASGKAHAGIGIAADHPHQSRRV